MSQFNAMQVLSVALNNAMAGSPGPVQLKYAGESSGSFTFTPSAPFDNASTLTYKVGGLTNGSTAGMFSQWGTWTTGGTYITPTIVIPNGGWTPVPALYLGDPGHWTNIPNLPYIPPQPVITTPAPISPDEIIRLVKFYEELQKNEKITIDDKKLKKAAKDATGKEPTQEELDEIRRQIRDRLVTEEREL